jgi:S-DNA-T family DNA segregation ATPase FtsK/SpoIIIE
MAIHDSLPRHERETRRLLPQGVGAALRRRLIELAGLALAGLGVATALACLSYAPRDPSLNRATDMAAENLLGWPGAFYADLTLQGLGLAAGLASLLLLAWGLRLLRSRKLPFWGLQLLLAPLALLAGGIALAGRVTPEAWPLQSGLGGVAGDLLSARLAAASQLDAALVSALAAAVALTLVLHGLALSRGEWRGLARGTGCVLRGGAGLAWRAVSVLRRPRRAGVEEDKAAFEDLEDSFDEPAEEEVEAEAKPKSRRARKRAERARKEPRLMPAASPAKSAELVAPKAKRPQPGKKGRAAGQGHLALGGGYETPPLTLLNEPLLTPEHASLNRDALQKNARLLEGVLQDFGVHGEIVKVRPGPVVTRYELEPAPGTKTSRVVGLADDIARSMSAISVRVAVVPGSSVIGIELPNARRETVFLRELLASQAYEHAKGHLPLILGKDIGGNPQIVDLARMPHLLVAGTTGSGKSVALNAMILSLLYRLPPDKCRLIMVDPKMLELSVYDDIPHLLTPVVTEPKKAVVALKWAVREMESRYRAMSRLGVRNVDNYNQRVEQARRSGEVLTRRVQTGFDPDTGQPVFEEEPLDLEPLPFIVVVVDEMADLMLVAGKDVEAAIQRLAQMARAAGIHIIMATQRPSVDVITGTIKANFPTRISFHVTSKIDSRTILGESGAEHLLGMGDMLYMAHGGRISRVHGPFITDEEVEEVVAFLKTQGQPAYLESITEDEAEPADFEAESSGDELFDRAVAVVAQHRKASTSFIQRQLQIGYNRAARLIEQMEAQGMVGPANHVGKREVLLPDHGEQ